ncbi:UbiA family prenyltransferase [Nocardia sp. NRRL WC-3656]|uniref:UbiA family prenyltransferase n=1 Tax=Nocardia sp. NRRL WC-3656 TaxID=1463824 RepID=UPI0004C4383B|nr:UbiA family prenyltransferase [Nocardia sp. NRRL WC-3656]
MPDPAPDPAAAPEPVTGRDLAPATDPALEPDLARESDAARESDLARKSDAARESDPARKSDPARESDSVSEPGAATPVDDVPIPRMPFTVRAAQVLALGLAVVGVGCTVTAGWVSGWHVALITGLSFVASWILGAVALAFGAVGASIRISAVLLAVLNALWTVPSIVVGRPPGWLGPVVSVLVAGLLLRRSARDWFEP